MILAELLSATRSTLDDTVQPYLWGDDELTRWMNNAVREVCIRGRMLKVDAVSDPKRCLLPLQAGVASISLDASILVPGSGMLTGQDKKLHAVTAASMDKINDAWDNGNQTPATPEYMIMDLAQKSIRLHPVPDVAYELRLRCWRVPVELEEMETSQDEPIIHLSNAEDLKHWACYEAYLKQGSETYDTAKAETQLAIFESRFGSRPTFHDMARWADSPPRVRRAHMY